MVKRDRYDPSQGRGNLPLEVRSFINDMVIVFLTWFLFFVFLLTFKAFPCKHHLYKHLDTWFGSNLFGSGLDTHIQNKGRRIYAINRTLQKSTGPKNHFSRLISIKAQLRVISDYKKEPVLGFSKGFWQFYTSLFLASFPV